MLGVRPHEEPDMKNVYGHTGLTGRSTVNIIVGALCGFVAEWMILIFLPGFFLSRDKFFAFGMVLVATLLNGFLSAWVAYMIVIVIKGRDPNWLFRNAMNRYVNWNERSAGWFLGVTLSIVTWAYLMR